MRFIYRMIVMALLLTAGIAESSKADNVPDATELAALHDLYTSLGGASWLNRTNWPSGTWPATATSTDFATWYGVQVINGDVVGINLSGNNLAGTIPSSIGNLTGLWSLYLNNNSIQGGIPAEVGNIASLFYLMLYGNQLTGALPSTLGSLGNLLQLNADGNQLTGAIPTTLGNLSNLTTLSLANNQLSGTIPSSLTGLTNLSTLYLYGNQLIGTIPANINGLTNLVYLGLSDNQLSGPVPAGLGSLTHLVYLNLSNNTLSGSIPATLGNAVTLQDVNLSGNHLTGELPASLSNLTALFNLSVANNALTGSVPASVANMPSLLYLVLQSNDFTFFPGMSASANRGNIYIYLSDNQLGFGSLEANIDASGQSVITHLTLGSIRTHSVLSAVRVDVGKSLIIPAHDPGQYSTITWEKQASDGSWVNINASNEDATQKTFKKTTAAATDGGRYRYSMRNSKIPAFQIESAPIYAGIGKDVVWNGQSGVSGLTGILTKTAAAGWGNAGAHSENVLAASQDGWVEFVVDKSSLTSNYIIGLSAVDNSYAVNTVAYGLEVLTTQRIAYHEANATGTDLTGWAPGDVFRIAREGASLKYYKNGTVIRTVAVGTTAYEAKALLQQGTSPAATASFWLPASRGTIPDAWEFAALKDFYDSLGGSTWKSKTNWPTVGNWVANITATQMDAWAGITVAGGDISGISLASNLLTGRMPQSIGTLTALTALVVNDNQITGSLPTSIGNLTKLTNLRLSENNLTGSIPSTIGNLTKLTYLSFYRNVNLTGTLPASFYNLVNLVNLYIFDTQIGGPLSEQIGSFTKLVEFWGYNNKFTGPLPASLANIPTLTNLYLYSNNFSGAIPSNWQNFAKIQNLWIHYNANLTGELPSWLGNLTSLVTLSIGESDMHGTLPASLSSLTKLTELYLWDLNLEGTIPESWQSLTNLTVLQVSNNAKLGGALPSWLVNSSKLKTMRFYDCSFTQFPDISARTDKSSLQISIQGNRIPVADIERYFTAANVQPFATFTYGPQQAEPAATPVYVPLHSDLSLQAVSGGAHGIYVWEKLVNGTWTDITSTNQSAEANKLVLPDAAAAMGGSYRYKVTNSWMPAILYQSNPIEVTITDAAAQSGKALFNGMISSVRWRTTRAYGTDDGDFTGMYVYDYDDKYQIKDASWATPNFALNTFQFEGNRFRLTGMEYDPNGNILALKRYDKNAAPLHNFSYSYEANKNKLTNVSGYVNAYTYNAIGQMVGEDKVDGDDQYVDYDVSGKVTAVYSDAAKTVPKVEYLYDDRGFRLAKINHADTTTTWYIRDASGSILSVYEQEGIAAPGNTHDAVQTEVPVYGSGKLGLYYPRQDSSMNYELTDHLGNVRALLRDDINAYTATMEDNGDADYRNPRVQEMALFEHIFETEYDDSFMNHTPRSAEVPEPKKAAYLFWNDIAGTTASEKAVGPAISLKVRAGDKLDIETWTRFEKRETFAKDFGLAALSTLLGNSFVSQGGFEGYTAAQTGANIGGVLSAASYPDNDDDNMRPYAYLNYIVYDENMVYTDAGFLRVTEDAGSSQADLHVPGHEPIRLGFDSPVTINQNGYIYVWVSNQSKEARVWFDDLTVRLSEQIVVQATDYGAWGDVLREQKSDERKYRFGYQGQYAERDEETGWSHFELREYDAVVGRWNNVDPYGQYWSPYIGMANNPVNGVDPDGGVWIPDENGNLIAEKGDNVATLMDYLGVSYEDASKIFNNFSNWDGGKSPSGLTNAEGHTLKLDNVFTNSISEALKNPFEFLDDAAMSILTSADYKRRMQTVQVTNYNCWGSAYSGTQGNPIVPGVGIGDGAIFDKLLLSSYSQVSSSNSIFGKTIIRFESGGVVQHGAVFYGRDKSGAIYVYTKNGWVARPKVMKLNDLITTIHSYGTPAGINGGSGYYNIKP